MKSTYSIELRDGGVHLTEQSPEGVIKKIVQVPDDLGKELAHLNLHLTDLGFAVECLDELDGLGYSAEGGITRQALWHSALVAAFKCFGNSKARSRLVTETIYTDAKQLEACEYWLNLRNKNIVHDDNDWTQSHVMAVVREYEYEPQIDNIYVITRTGWTHAQNANNGRAERLALRRRGRAAPGQHAGSNR
ncbi:hypothetical protein [Mycobacterium neglectum]|uniref:hypothetical protein n=1 Tax=Mycobacterium neglectum TaxID=242737 RepID=UPI000BFEAC4C|nr:hypothetical protein [Mycobacterium neglectum]